MTLWAARTGVAMDPDVDEFLRADDAELLPYDCAATALHAVAGFLGRQQVKTSHLVDAGGQLPVIIIFVDTDEHVGRVLLKLKEMAAHRLIVRENVVIEQGSLD